MKRLVILVLLASVLLPACGGAPPEAEPTAPPTTVPTEAVQPTATPEPTDTPTTEPPTATPEPTLAPTEAPSPTPEPTSTSEPTAPPEPTTPAEPTATLTTGPVVVFRDDFNGALGAGWSWVRQDLTHWNLTDVPGSLRIILQPGWVGDGSANNVLLRAVPAGNFEIATLVRFTPTSDFQFAGLLIYQDDPNALEFGRAFAGGWVRNGIYFDNITAGELVGSNYATVTASQSQAYLRLRREGTTYTGYYSEDGTNWFMIGQHTNGLTPTRVGVFAAQASQAETTADFDYFTITTLP